MKKLLLFSVLLIAGAANLSGAEIEPLAALDKEAITKKVNNVIAQSPITAELEKRGVIVSPSVYTDTSRMIIGGDATITVYLMNIENIGYIHVELYLTKKSGKYNRLWINPQYRDKNYAKSLINLGITLMNAFDIEHRIWDAQPLDATTHRDGLEKLYSNHGGSIIQRHDKEERTSMEWHSPSAIRAKL